MELMMTLMLATTLIVQCARGDFVLVVNLVNYTNPTGLCAECQTRLFDNGSNIDQLVPVCCDDMPVISENCDNTGEERCDTRFRWRIREYGSSLDTRPTTVPMAEGTFPYNFTDCSLSDMCPSSEMSFTFGQGQDGFLGVTSNPLFLPPSSLRNFTAWTGRIQFFIEAVDSGLPNIIDSLLVNLDLQLGANFTEERTYSGYHNISHITMSFRVECNNGFCGKGCTITMTNNNNILSCETNGDIVCNQGFNPASNCNSCLHNLNFTTDCTTCLQANFDPDSNCTTCLQANFDPDSNCTTCLQANFDPDSNCTACLPGYDRSTDCSTCLAAQLDPSNNCLPCSAGIGFDPANNCSTCMGPLFDPDNGCTSCLAEGYDPQTNCTLCLSNRAIDANCAVCLPGWDTSSDCNTCLPGYDMEANCTLCLPNREPSSNCTVCLPDWDINADCLSCLPRRDLATNCTLCLQPERYSDTDCNVCVLPGGDPETQCTTCRDTRGDPDAKCTIVTEPTASLNVPLVAGIAGGVAGLFLIIIIVLIAVLILLTVYIKKNINENRSETEAVEGIRMSTNPVYEVNKAQLTPTANTDAIQLEPNVLYGVNTEASGADQTTYYENEGLGPPTSDQRQEYDYVQL